LLDGVFLCQVIEAIAGGAEPGFGDGRFATGQIDDGLVQQEDVFFGIEGAGGFLQSFGGAVYVAGTPCLQARAVLLVRAAAALGEAAGGQQQQCRQD